MKRWEKAIVWIAGGWAISLLAFTATLALRIP